METRPTHPTQRPNRVHEPTRFSSSKSRPESNKLDRGEKLDSTRTLNSIQGTSVVPPLAHPVAPAPIPTHSVPSRPTPTSVATNPVPIATPTSESTFFSRIFYPPKLILPVPVLVLVPVFPLPHGITPPWPPRLLMVARRGYTEHDLRTRLLPREPIPTLRGLSTGKRRGLNGGQWPGKDSAARGGGNRGVSAG